MNKSALRGALYSLEVVRREMRYAHKDRRLGQHLQFRWELRLALADAAIRKSLKREKKK